LPQYTFRTDRETDRPTDRWFRRQTCTKSVYALLTLLVGVLTWLSVWGEMQIFIWPRWCHCHWLSPASVKSRLVLVPAHPGNPGQVQRAVKWTCVCVRASVHACVRACYFNTTHPPNHSHLSPQKWEWLDGCAVLVVQPEPIN